MEVDNLLLGGDKQDFHLPWRYLRVDDLEVKTHFVDPERNVLFGLPLDGLSSLFLRHFLHGNASYNDAPSGDSAVDALVAWLDTCLPDDLANRVNKMLTIHDLTINNGSGSKLLDCVAGQGYGLARPCQLNHFDGMAADIKTDSSSARSSQDEHYFPFPGQHPICVQYTKSLQPLYKSRCKATSGIRSPFSRISLEALYCVEYPASIP